MTPTDTRIERSINTAISNLLVSVVLIVTVFYSLLLVAYSWVIEDNIFNRQVQDETDYIQRVYQATGNIVEPRSAYMVLHPNWRGLPEQFKQEQAKNPDKIEFDYPDGRTIHIQLFTIADTPYVLAGDVEAYEVSRDFLPRMIWALVILSLVCCGTVAAIALLKARKITQPLNRLAEQVSSHQKIEDVVIQGDYPNNEIGALAGRIKEAFERLTQTWAREANFTKDVSHEIRTPVAIAKNILAKPLNQLKENEWHVLNDVNLRLEQTTETLLALARNESTQLSHTNLTELLEHCLLTNSDVNHSKKGQNIKFKINSTEEVFRTINPNLTEILFNNILSNIVHYTAGAWVSIQISQSDITFINRFQETPPDNPLQSGEKGGNSQGIGHGLSLIKRIASVYQWRVKVDVAEQEFKLIVELKETSQPAVVDSK